MLSTLIPPGEPVRRGLPVDPVLQLYAGEFRPLPTVATPGGTWVQIAPANPNRVALYVQTLPALVFLAPEPEPTAVDVSRTPTVPSAPIVLHCRDYPGMTQGEWWALTVAVQDVRVWEYALLPHW